MLVYCVILFAVAVLFGVMSAQIYRGKTELIHDYHQTKVTDKAAYGKAFGKALSLIGVGAFASGVIALLGERAMPVSLAVLILGLIAGIACIVVVQKKYNKGIF